jgi:hypothetical protein
MSKNFLTLIVLIALVHADRQSCVRMPSVDALRHERHHPIPRSLLPPSRDSQALAGHQPPIPLVRNAPALPTTATSPDVPAPGAEMQAPDDLDLKAAKAAIEADGYKGVSLLGKGTDGAWRAKAYRGTTEVQLMVDGTGKVSAE